MEYNTFVKDFVKRTYRNLEHIEQSYSCNVDDVYEFTQLVNSLLGLLVIPQEKERGRINNDYVSEGILLLLQRSIILDDYNNDSFNEILRHMRNAIAHGSIEVSSTNGEISSIKFTDRNRFIIELSCSQLRNFIRDFASNLLKKL